MVAFSRLMDLSPASPLYGHALVTSAILALTVRTIRPLISGRGEQPPLAKPEFKGSISGRDLSETIEILEPDGLIAKQQFQSRSDSEVGLNCDFLRELRMLLDIMIPKLLCPETLLLSLHTICLISRTFLSIYVATLEGASVKFIVRKDIKNFIYVLLKWLGIAIPATFINSMIRFLESKVALSFRTRLVRHSYRLYFKNQNYYRISNLDSRIENPDHRLTDDIAVFSSSVAHLYSSLTKPCFDLILISLALLRFSININSNILSGPLLSVSVIILTAYILRVISPKFGQMASEEANLYGYLKHIHSRIITNAEEIAFYGGHKVELQQLRHAYNKLVKHINIIYIQRLWFVMVEQFFTKYVWSGTGMVMVSLPILATAERQEERNTPSFDYTGVSERTHYLTTAKNLLISASDAIERLMASYREVTVLAGYTHRVAGVMKVFEETSQGIYCRRNTVDKEQNESSIVQLHHGAPLPNGQIKYTDDKNMTITLRNVPVITPNCDIVVSSLNLCIQPGMHVLITGPNGCGKSSLFRILSGLWPIYAGEMTIPKSIGGVQAIFYIPQRPYLPIGSLCDQIIYPDTEEDMQRKNKTKDDLRSLLSLVHLEHIFQRDQFAVVRDWKDILSGGEKQRLGIARMFYHRPKYALLDECTSAVSVDVESSIYQIALDMGITLLSITHRSSLWQFHTHILAFDGQGNWVFRKMSLNERQAKDVLLFTDRM